MASAAKTGVLTFRVFPDDNPIQVARLAVKERARDSRQKTRRPDIGVLIEAMADGQPEAPPGDMGGHLGIPDCSEIDGVECAQPFKAVWGHHAPVLIVVIGAPWECLQLKAEPRLAILENSQDSGSRLDHLHADSVARYHSYSIATHLD